MQINTVREAPGFAVARHIWDHNNLLPQSPLIDLERNWPCFLEEPCYSRRKDFLLDLSFIISMLLLHQIITESI